MHFYLLLQFVPVSSFYTPGVTLPVNGSKSATFRALLFERFVVGGKSAIRVITASVKFLLFFVYLLYQFIAAFRAFYPGLYLVRTGCLAFGISAAGKQLAEASGLDYHRLAAIWAYLLGHFVRKFYSFHRFGSLGQILLERRIKIPYDTDPVPLFTSYLIQFVFHFCCKFNVDTLRKIFADQIINHNTKFRRLEVITVFYHVFTFLDR